MIRHLAAEVVVAAAEIVAAAMPSPLWFKGANIEVGSLLLSGSRHSQEGINPGCNLKLDLSFGQLDGNCNRARALSASYRCSTSRGSSLPQNIRDGTLTAQISESLPQRHLDWFLEPTVVHPRLI